MDDDELLSAASKEFLDKVEAKIGAQDSTLKEFRENLSQIEQKMARRSGGNGSGMEEKSYGEQLVESAGYKHFRSSGSRGTTRIELKTVSTATAPGTWSARDTQLSELARRTLRVRNLLTILPTGAGSVDWARQITRTNNAGVVAEAAQKPTSVYAWEQTNTPMRTIAHLAKLTRQAMDDDAQLAAELDYEMRYGLGLAEEVELLNGDGTGQHLTGLIPAASAYSSLFEIADLNMIDVLGLALLQQSLTEFETDGVILHPSDWMKIRLIKNNMGDYIMGDPASYVEPRIFGLPVVPTQGIAAGQFLVGGFKLQKLYDRMAPEVVIASENADDFEHNMLTARCEERLGLAIRKPDALIHGDFATALAE